MQRFNIQRIPRQVGIVLARSIIHRNSQTIRNMNVHKRFRHESRDVSDNPGLHKTPIVNELWQLRKLVLQDKQRDSIATIAKQEAALANESKIGELPQKSPAESYTSVTYKFQSDSTLRAKYVNPFDSIRIGRIVEDLDALAGTIAFKHCQDTSGTSSDTPSKMLLVTAAVDRIALKHRANLKNDIRLEGKVSWTGRSSMNIKMRAISDWTDEPFLEANFLFVARNPANGQAIAVNPILPITPEEKSDFEEGEARNESRKKQRRLARTPKEKWLEGGTVSVEEVAAKLVQEAQSLIDLPTLGSGDRVLMEQTNLETALMMQPQQVNTAGRVFGGYLMRKAYELAFSTAYLFQGNVPRFIEVDEVHFHQPVDVGDLVRFQSKVLFSSTTIHNGMPSIHVEVLAHVVKPELVQVKQSNTFYFTFTAPKGTELKSVLPRTMEDALRVVERIEADTVQALERVQ